MNEQVEVQGGGGDTFMMVAAVLLVVAGVAAYYVLGSGNAAWMRWSAVGAGLVLGALVFALSATGRGFFRFVMESRIELRKVVWPDKDTTWKTTALVFGFVTVAGLFFWILDLFLAWATKWLTGQGG
jgi:preprotein translocase subunit SecE